MNATIRISRKSVVSTIVSITSIIAAINLLFNISDKGYGYQYLFIVPLTFGLYYPFGKLSKIDLFDLPITIFRVFLIIRMVIIPLLMVCSNNYSTTFFSFNDCTTEHERVVATFVLLYEQLTILVTAEICASKYSKTNDINSYTGNSLVAPIDKYYICWFAVIVGFCGLLFYSAIQNRLYFFFADDSTEFAPMTFVPALFYTFSRIAVLLVTIIIANMLKKNIQSDRNNNLLVLLFIVFSILSIGFRWSDNRMSIVRNTLLVMMLWFYVYPNKKKIILIILSLVSMVAIVGVSAYKWYGAVGGSISLEDFDSFQELSEIAKFLQLYCNGVDGLAFGVKTKELFDGMSIRVFINDTLRNIEFFNQLILYGNTTKLSNVYNEIVGQGYNIGYIIPMTSQASIHFSYLLAPVYSVLCTVGLFMSEKLMYKTNNFGKYYLYLALALEFSFFQCYNYTLMIANIVNNVILIFLIIQMSSIIKLKR